MKNIIKFLFHVHTRASFDSLMSVRSIVNNCARNGIDALAICDHDSAAALPQAQTQARRRGIYLVPGIEHSTDAGDIIGLYCTQPITSRKAADVIRTIKCADGIAILPHPMKDHDLDAMDLEEFDVFETFSSRCTEVENRAAADLARKLDKLEIAGADAHFSWELSLCVNTYETGGKHDWRNPHGLARLLKHAPLRIKAQYSTPFSISLSQLIKGIKLRRPGLIYSSCKTLPRQAGLWVSGS